MYIAVGTYIYITLVPLCELWEVVLFVVYTLIALVSFCIRDFLTVFIYTRKRCMHLRGC